MLAKERDFVGFSRESIVSKHFSRKVFGGFNKFEVRDFLHILAEEMRHLNVLVEKQAQRIKELEEHIQDYRDREHILKRSIVSAQEIADKIQKDTEQKSQLIIARANDKSESLIRQARSSLQSVYNDIASLKRLHLQFRSNLKASLQSQMDLLEQTPLFSLSLPEGETSSADQTTGVLPEDSTVTADFSPETEGIDGVADSEGSSSEKSEETKTGNPETSPSDSPEETEKSLDTLTQSLQSLEKDLF